MPHRDLNFVFPPSGRIVRAIGLASLFAFAGGSLLGQTADQPSAAPSSDAEQRLKWLKLASSARSHGASENDFLKDHRAAEIGFRSSPQNIGTRAVEAEPPAPIPSTAAPAEKRSADSHPAEPTPAKSKPAEIAKPRGSETRIAKATPVPAAKSTPAPVAKVMPAQTPSPVVAEPTPAKSKSAESRTAKVTPSPSPAAAHASIAKATPAKATPPAVVAEPTPSKTSSAETRVAKATPAPPVKATPTPTQIAKLTTPAPLSSPPPSKTRIVETHATPSPKPTPTPAIANTLPVNPPSSKTPASTSASGRYNWKTNIVTTVFWIGEPVGGHNFTANYSSSWDAHWTKNFGGLDTPDPSARRNFIPMKFTPHQNPFYVALPYNDVTRGTTKPEARRVIPWFKEAFCREGQSVCRDRWVAIRNRAGQTVYAQWSDCGPFRTDHWAYVFGNDRPRPNLNQGAGLDVSPAVRDYLALDGTDVTDWKFVDFKEVPNGPWSRYGDNNTFVLKGSRPSKSPAKAKGRTADTASRLKLGEL